MQRREKASADAGQVDERRRQADRGQIGDPGLVEAAERGALEQVGIRAVAVGRVGRHDEAPLELAQQGLLAHHAQHPLVIDRSPFPARSAQCMGHPPVAVAGEVQHDPLDGVASGDPLRYCGSPIRDGMRVMRVVPPAAEAEPAAAAPRPRGRDTPGAAAASARTARGSGRLARLQVLQGLL